MGLLVLQMSMYGVPGRGVQGRAVLSKPPFPGLPRVLEAHKDYWGL